MCDFTYHLNSDNNMTLAASFICMQLVYQHCVETERQRKQYVRQTKSTGEENKLHQKMQATAEMLTKCTKRIVASLFGSKQVIYSDE